MKAIDINKLKEEANRCFLCKVPKCKKYCPIDTQIPAVIQLFKENKIDEAGEILFNNNPLSAICGVVCPHEDQCLGNCIRGIKDEPVNFYEIESFISREYLKNTKLKQENKLNERIAIIGSGPAGISLALILAKKGYKVTIFEKRSHIGGVLRYGHYAIDYLKSPNSYRLGDNVVIIGAGNVAMDAARTAKNHGASNVTVVYRKGFEDMTATKAEIKDAKEDGVNFELFKASVEIIDEGVIFIDTKKLDDERKTMVNIEGSEKLINADSVIIAISQSPKNNIVSNTKNIDTNKYGLLVTDDEGHTTRECVFASGDVVTGAKTVVEAVANAKKVANSIEEYLKLKRV